MNRPNVDSLKPDLFHENVSAAIDSANHEVGGHGEEQGASCGEKKPCDQAAVDGKVPEHLDHSHIVSTIPQIIFFQLQKTLRAFQLSTFIMAGSEIRFSSLETS